MYRKIRCPVLLIHGDNDQIQPYARAQAAYAEVSGAELVTIEGGGHNPLGRYPAKANALINDFLDRTARHRRARADAVPAHDHARSARSISPRRSASATAAATSPSRASCASSIPTCRSTGWRRTRSRACSNASGERVHPLSARLASEIAAYRARKSGEHELHCFQAIRRMDEVLIANFMIFQDAVEQGGYDLVIADEAWDIDHYWHEHPELKKAKLAWFTDFVGYVPMPAGGEHEAFLTTDYNAEMIEHIEQHPGRARSRDLRRHARRHRAACRSAQDLPAMRDWMPKHFDFAGYIIGEHPQTLRQPGTSCAKGWATAPTSGFASSPSAARASART